MSYEHVMWICSHALAVPIVGAWTKQSIDKGDLQIEETALPMTEAPIQTGRS